MSATNSNPNLPPRSSSGRGLAKNARLDKVVDFLATVSSPQPIGDEPVPLAWTLSFPAIIWNAGPNGEADFTPTNSGGRYWIKPQQIDSDNVGSPTNTATLVNDLSHNLAAIEVATNLAEGINGMDALGAGELHAIRKGTIVWVYLLGDRFGATHYVFNQPMRRLIPAALTKTLGSDGTATSRASWQYDAADFHGSVFASNLSYGGNRPLGSLEPASRGLVELNGTNVTLLAVFDEVPQYSTTRAVTDFNCNAGTAQATFSTFLSL